MKCRRFGIVEVAARASVDENVENIPLDRFSDQSQADEVKETPISTQQKMPNINSAIIEAESRAKQSKNLEQLKASLQTMSFVT